MSVIELFLHGITLDRLSNCVYPDRADQPPIALLERCQHFGDFRQFLMDQLSDEHWRSLAPEGQHTVTFQQYCGIVQSHQEEQYCSGKTDVTFDQLVKEHTAKLESPQQHGW